MSCWVSKICQSEKEGQFFNLKFWPYLHIVMNKESKFIKSNCITCQVSYTFHYFKFCLLCPYLSLSFFEISLGFKDMSRYHLIKSLLLDQITSMYSYLCLSSKYTPSVKHFNSSLAMKYLMRWIYIIYCS